MNYKLGGEYSQVDSSQTLYFLQAKPPSSLHWKILISLVTKQISSFFSFDGLISLTLFPFTNLISLSLFVLSFHQKNPPISVLIPDISVLLTDKSTLLFSTFICSSCSFTRPVYYSSTFFQKTCYKQTYISLSLCTF